ncbi:hypothetical protein ACROYT_G005921 [Oculina patagonica]
MLGFFDTRQLSIGIAEQFRTKILLKDIPQWNYLMKTKERPISETVKVRRWRWIGHILRREKDNNCRVALTWIPEGKRKRGRPKISWRRTVEGERKDLGWTSWNEVEQRARDREGWRTFLGSLMLQLEKRRG